MKIISLSMENFRSFQKETQISSIKPVSLIIGPNMAGKSNIFEALEFLRGLVQGKPLRLIPDYFYDKLAPILKLSVEIELNDEERKDIFSLLPDPEIIKKFDLEKEKIFQFFRYHVEVDKNGIAIELLFTSDKKGDFVTLIQSDYRGGEIESIRLDTSFERVFLSDSKEGDKQKNGLEVTVRTKANTFTMFHHGGGYPENFIAEKIKKLFSGIRIVPAYRKPNPRMQFAHTGTLADDLSDLVNFMNTLQSTTPKDFVKISTLFTEIIDEAEDVIAPPKPTNEIVALMTEKGLRNKIELENMSTGSQQLLGLIFLVETAKTGEIICIEEPEIHLNATPQRKLLDIIKNKSKTNQIFITSHSSIFVEKSDICNTYMVLKKEDGSHAALINEENDLKLLKHILGIRNSDVFGNHHDYVLFVEGDSEFVAFPLIAKAIGFDEIGNEIQLTNLKGSGKVQRLELLLRYLKNSKIESFLIADKDKDVSKKINDFVREDLIVGKNTEIWSEGEFEDIFSSKRIIDCFNKIVARQNISITLSEEELSKERRKRKVADILGEKLQEKWSDLVKPELAKELAFSIINEFRNNEAKEDARRIIIALENIRDRTPFKKTT